MTPSPETLLAETRWLERMARSLVADPHLAADLAQDAWLATQGAPRPRGERRPWLLGVLRKLAHRTFRSSGRRQRHELARPSASTAEATAEVLARTELHSRLLQLVRDLPEAYRAPLLLRFFDDLPPRRIAERLALPVNTVNTRIQRGLAQLRGKLDDEHGGDRRAWVAVLAVRPATPLLTPALLLGGALAAAGLAAVAVWRSSPSPQPERADASIAAAPGAPSQSRSPATVAPSARNAAEELPATEPARLRGRVLDWDGRPVAGAVVTTARHLGISWRPDAGDDIDLEAGPSTTLATPSDHDGAFALPRPTQATELRATHTDHVCALVCIWRPDDPSEPRVVLTPATSVVGRVVDDTGVAVTDAEVRIELPNSTAGGNQDRLHALRWQTTTTADGAFVLPRVPAVAGTRLRLSKSGHLTQVLTAPLPAVLSLPRWPSAFGGKVVDRSGHALASATVVGADTAVQTDRDGSYLLPGARGSVWIVAPGYQPTWFPEDAALPHTLALADLAVHGSLLLPDGKPASGWSISLFDPTCVGGSSPIVLEAIAGGSGPVVHRTATTVDGQFRLRGLRPRAYRFRCVDPTTAAAFVTEPLLPEASHTLRLPALWLPERKLALRSLDGAPLAAAVVTVQATAYGVPGADGDLRPVIFAHGSSGCTDAAGSIVLDRVPRAGAALRIHHTTTGVVTVAIETLPDHGVIVLPRQGDLLVRCQAPHPATWLELADADGRPLAADCLSGVGKRSAVRWELVAGCAPVLSVPETAVVLRFGDAAGERGQMPLHIRPGALLTIDL